MKKRPNILIFNPDQFRSDALGHMGCKAAVTPNLDRLVREDAVSFRNAFCQNPVCTPSRCSFMSGWYPHVRGHRTMFHMMQEGEPVLLKVLKDEGYFVWWGGKNDLVPGQNPIENYCSYYHRSIPQELAPNLHQVLQNRGREGNKDYYSMFVGRVESGEKGVYHDGDWSHVMGAVDFIRSASTEQSLCLYLPLGYPHPPYGVEEPWYSGIDREKVEAPYPVPGKEERKPSILEGIREGQGLQHWTPERWKELRATYYGMCSRIDHQLGLVIQALKDKGIYEDTAIFVFSDHGDFTGDYGLVEKTQNTFEDVLVKVPFVIKPPKGVELRPGIRDALVELVDFPATVEELTGIQLQYSHFGRSLVPLLAEADREHRDAVFCEGGRLHGEEHCKEKEGIARFKEKENSLYWPRARKQHGDGPEHGKAVMIRTEAYKYVRRLYESDELYDLKQDPRELHNRIDDENLAGVLAALKERLMQFYMETCDVVPYKTDARDLR